MAIPVKKCDKSMINEQEIQPSILKYIEVVMVFVSIENNCLFFLFRVLFKKKTDCLLEQDRTADDYQCVLLWVPFSVSLLGAKESYIYINTVHCSWWKSTKSISVALFFII